MSLSARLRAMSAGLAGGGRDALRTAAETAGLQSTSLAARARNMAGSHKETKLENSQVLHQSLRRPSASAYNRRELSVHPEEFSCPSEPPFTSVLFLSAIASTTASGPGTTR